MIDITRGNPWQLNIALTQDGSAVEIASTSDLHVTLISETVVNFPYSLDEVMTLANNVISVEFEADDLPVGVYGIEVKRDDEWRVFGKRMIRITEETVAGGTHAASVGGDSYDVVLTANGIVANVSMAIVTQQQGGGGGGSTSWNDISDKPTFATVATSGSYNDLSDTPTIPSLSGYATQTWVGQQGFLTQHQDINGKADKVVVVDASTLPASLEPNKVYQMGTLTGSVTIPPFSAVASGDTEAKIWCFTFSTGSTAPTITWPAGITGWSGGSAPTISASKSYEVSVMDGIAVIIEV